jgi:hypothetical protein
VLAALCLNILHLTAPTLSLGATAHFMGDGWTDVRGRNACMLVTAARRPSITG